MNFTIVKLNHTLLIELIFYKKYAVLLYLHLTSLQNLFAFHNEPSTTP